WEHVVDNETELDASDRVFEHHEDVHPRLQLIADTLGFDGKFVWLSDMNETGTEVIRQSRGENESSGLDAKDNIRPKRPDLLGEGIDDFAKTGLVLQQGRDVIKEDALLWEVWNLADHFLQVIHVQPRMRNEE